MRFCFSLACALGFSASLAAAGLSERDRVTSVISADPSTGRLVRKLVVQKRAAPPATPPCEGSAQECAAKTVRHAVEKAAAQHAVPAELIHSVIQVESNYNPYAVSPKGAQGIMQLIPATARRFGVENVFDAAENIQGGAKYLRYLLDMFGGNYTLALAAYNAGEAAVTRYGGVPPYTETRNYVQQVGKRLEAIKPAAPPAPAVPQPGAAPEAPAGPSHIQEIVEPDGRVRYVSQ
jgi:soluble lytic murein transglycosylase-like protein